MKWSRLLTLVGAALVGGLSQVKPQWADLLYAALGLAGWAIPHVADKDKK